MADIRASLSLDDSKFTTKLSAAEAKARAFGQTAGTSLSSLNTGLGTSGKSLDALNTKFDKMGQVLAGVGIAAFTKSLFDSAREVKDLASAVDLSIQSMLEMGTAAAYAGSSMAKVSDMVGKMEIAAGQAADGNVGLRESFAKLGISMEDMTRLTPSEMFNQIAKSLAAITNPAERAAKASEVFGKTWKGINFGDYAKNLDEVTGTMGKYADAQQTANDVGESVSLQMDLIKVSATNMLKPILDVVTGTGSLSDKMDRAETVANLLGIALGAIAVGGIVTGLKSLIGVMTTLAAATGFNTAATVESAGALSAESLALIANNSLRHAGNVARVESLTTSLAEAQARALAAAGLATEAGLLATVEKLQWRLSAAQAALASTGGTAAVAEGMVGAGAGAAIVPVTGLAVAVRGLVVSMGAMAAVSAAFIAGAAGIQEIYNQLTGKGSGQNFLYKWLTEDDEATKKLTETSKDSTEQAVLAKDAIKQVADAYASQTQAIKNSTANMLADNLLQKQRNDLLAQQVQVGKANTDAAIAGLEAQNKYKQQSLEIDKQIAEAKEKAAKTPGSNPAATIAALEAQRTAMKQIANESAAATKAEGERQDRMAMAAMYVESEKKAKETLKSLEYELADISKSETEKKLAQVDRLIAKEVELAIAKRQAQLGTDNPISTSEADAIAAKIRDQYSAMKQLTEETIRQTSAQNLLNFAKNEELSVAHQLDKILDETATQTMTEIEKKYYAIGAAARDSAKSAIEAEEARRGTKLNPSEVKAYYDAATKGSTQLYAATKKSYDMSRTWETGWTKAMKSYVEAAGDASKTAAELFTKATQGMEDAIVGFAKTGKFEWKSFAADMLETLLRSQIQQTFAAMMSSMQQSTGGLLGAIGSLFGGSSSSSSSSSSGGGGIMDAIGSLFGGSGSTQQGNPVYVTNWPTALGGSGGGASSILSGAASLLSPSTTTGGGSTLGSIWDSVTNLFGGSSGSSWSTQGGQYNNPSAYVAPQQDNGFTSVLSSLSDGISSFTSGISDFFGGFFAGGGSLPAGKFGIVGEKGPELITGPANIYPGSSGSGSGGGSGGVTNVSYTIYANDAQSFAQMLARDPSLIYALTQQGAKGMRAA